MPTGIYERTKYHRKRLKEGQNCLRTKKKKREAMLAYWQDSEWRRKQIEIFNQPKTKQKQSRIQSRTQKKVHSRPEVKKKHRERMIRFWQNLEWAENQIKVIMKGSIIKPNKAELKLDKLLQQILPDEYKYVGDGQIFIARKCPDFINVNSQKKIIELFGNYWHQGDDGEERMALFKQYGYETLIVWESELEDRKKLRDKILEFNSV